MIEARSGVSEKKNSFHAGKQAAESTKAGLPQAPDIVFVFAGIDFDQQEVLSGVNSVFPGTQTIGCTTDGEISSLGLSLNSVVVLSLACDIIKFHTVSVESLSANSYRAGAKVGESFKNLHCRYLQIFSDGLTGNGTKIIEGIQSVLGHEVNISGGTAGDGGFFTRTYQYHNDRVLTDSLVAVAFEGDFPFGTGVESGWIPIGLAKEITKSVGNIVYTVDDQPALNVYEKFLGKHASELPAVGVEYPLGIVSPDGEIGKDDYFLCRAVMGVDRENQSIILAGEIPQGALVKMTMGSESEIIKAAETAATQALLKLKNIRAVIQPKVIFVYSCMARKIVMGSKTNEELLMVKEVVGHNVPIIGFYTYGEYSPVGALGRSHLHNETIAITILGE